MGNEQKRPNKENSGIYHRIGILFDYQKTAIHVSTVEPYREKEMKEGTEILK